MNLLTVITFVMMFVAAAAADEEAELSNGAKAGLSLGFFFGISSAMFIGLWYFDRKDAEQDLLVNAEQQL